MSSNGHYSFPPDLYYDPATHVWTRRDGASVTVGLDALGLESLGDMAYLSLRAVGGVARRGESLGTMEAAKMVGDLIAPISGTILAVNEDVVCDPGIVNREPYGAGWIVQITPSDWQGDSAELVHGEALAAWIAAEIERYRQQGWIQ